MVVSVANEFRGVGLPIDVGVPSTIVSLDADEDVA